MQAYWLRNSEDVSPQLCTNKPSSAVLMHVAVLRQYFLQLIFWKSKVSVDRFYVKKVLWSNKFEKRQVKTV